MSQPAEGTEPAGDAAPGRGAIPPKIVVRNATRRFGGLVAFEGLSFEVAQHEVLCILGPSGCGKTSLLRVLDGLLTPTSGEVLIDGRPVTCPSRDVAMVFQHFGLFPWKRLDENIAYGLRLLGRPRGEVRTIVEN